MKAIIIYACVLLTVSASEELWNQFKNNHVKAYATEEEHNLRYQIFENNLASIEKHNKQYEQGIVGWYKAVNQFTDMTEDEFKATLTLKEFNQTGKAPVHMITYLNIPASIDWRQSGVVTTVKNQGGCGSCWSFSATGTLEGIYALNRNQLLSFSEQNLIDCATSNSGYSCSGCTGGVIQSALDYIRDHGITTEDQYSYKAQQGTCSVSSIAVKTSGYTGIGWKDENGLKNAVGTVGPVSVALNANLLQSYGGGIFNTDCPDTINHGVLVVGYGNENGLDYWIVKNSWGGSWGESGYFRMAIGNNLCGLANQACYPNL